MTPDRAKKCLLQAMTCLNLQQTRAVAELFRPHVQPIQLAVTSELQVRRPHWSFRGCRVHSEFKFVLISRPASWLPLLSRTFTFELSLTGSPQANVEYDYVGKQSTPTTGLSPASPTALWAAELGLTPCPPDRDHQGRRREPQPRQACRGEIRRCHASPARRPAASRGHLQLAQQLWARRDRAPSRRSTARRPASGCGRWSTNRSARRCSTPRRSAASPRTPSATSASGRCRRCSARRRSSAPCALRG